VELFCTHREIRALSCTRDYTIENKQTNLLPHTHIHTHTHIHSHMHTHTHAQETRLLRIGSPTCCHTHTFTHAHTHAHTHTNPPTRIPWYEVACRHKNMDRVGGFFCKCEESFTKETLFRRPLSHTRAQTPVISHSNLSYGMTTISRLLCVDSF